MSVSSADSAEHKKPISTSEQSDETKESTSVSQLETVIPTEVILQSADTKPPVTDSSLPSEDEEKTTTYDANNFNFEASPSTSSLVKDDLEDAPEKTSIHDAKGTSTEIDSFQNEKMESDASGPQEPSSIDQKPEIDGEHDKQSMERFASDQLETEEKKFVHGSRKASNPAFVAAQSKFEELTSMANSGKSSSLSNQVGPVESQADTSSIATDTACRTREFFPSENSATYPYITVGSECGTELSITSTLDSPDRSETGAKENEHDAKDLVERIDNPESKIDHGLEANLLQAAPTANLPNSNSDQLEIVDEIGGNIIHSGVDGNSEEAAVKSEQNASDLLREPEEAVLHDSKLSPEASPRSQQYQLGTPSSQVSMTIPESQGTPSSQVSIKPKESKTNKSGSSNRRRILSAGNESPANANHDSGSRGSREQLPKDQPSGKRRSSFGSVKSDHIDQEARDNSSTNSSLPHFMQATESARAKMNANNSPRSSPDVHDQDIHVKKRHSLPSATGRQGSPRIQRSPQQGTKGNGVHAHHGNV